MKIPKAHSLDVGEIISAERADQLYGEGKIRSKYRFECPEEDCHAQITCANLDKIKIKRKRDPYYIFVSGHRDGCLIEKDIKEKEKKAFSQNNQLEDKLSDAVVINLDSPSSTIIKSGKAGKGAFSGGKAILQEDNFTRETRNRKSKRRVTSLVDSFLGGKNFTVNVFDEVIQLEDLFIKIDEQDIGDLPDEPRIYYGKAWVNSVKGGFSIRFCDELQHGQLCVRPSFFLGQDMINNSPYKKYESHRLESMCNKIPKDFYILSMSSPYKANAGDYINLFCNGLQYLEYKE